MDILPHVSKIEARKTHGLLADLDQHEERLAETVAIQRTHTRAKFESEQVACPPYSVTTSKLVREQEPKSVMPINVMVSFSPTRGSNRPVRPQTRFPSGSDTPQHRERACAGKSCI